MTALIAGGQLVVGDGYRAKNSELCDRGLPFARAGNINEGFRFADADCFPEEDLDRVGNKISQPGDVVFTSKGTVGRFGYVRPETPRFVYSPQLCFWRSVDSELIDSRFLYYWMFGREFFVQFKGVAGQTDMAEYVSLTDQRKMHLTLPPLPEQRRIASILGTLDDKIELNRRMNRTLEEMAQAIFKSWFIDFDGHDDLVESELGLIPRGWEVVTLEDLLSVGVGGAWGEEDLSDKASEEVICLRGIDLHNLAERSLADVPHRWLTPSQLKKRRLLGGEILVEGSGSFCGRSLFFDEHIASLYGRSVVYSNFCKRLDPDCDRAFSLLAWYHLRRGYRSGETESYRTGTAFPNLDVRGLMANTAFPLPPLSIARRFKGIERSLSGWHLVRQSRILAALRDTLLPKLISGEIRVPEGEEIPEEAL